jgi:NADPH:quinone reductase-like Zn-dependent oxidoreductase
MRPPAGSTRAIRIEKHGPPETFVEREIPLPAPQPGELAIRVEAAGINFADLLMRAGLYDTVPPRPYSPGFEIAGIVSAVGEATEAADGEPWREGDPCVALLRHGGYACDVVLPTRNVFRRPPGLSAIEAAAAPVVFLTAHVCLFESARVRPGETALILGAGGGVGTAAVQLARQAGLQVIGTAGTQRKRSFVTGTLGLLPAAARTARQDRVLRVQRGDARQLAQLAPGGPRLARDAPLPPPVIDSAGDRNRRRAPVASA